MISLYAGRPRRLNAGPVNTMCMNVWNCMFNVSITYAKDKSDARFKCDELKPQLDVDKHRLQSISYNTVILI